MIIPIDDYVEKYMNKADLEDYHPLYKSMPTYKGKRWGFFDDGDMFALYYRKDIFEDPKLMAAYQAKFGKPLEVPKTWDDYSQTAQFITDKFAPNVYGAAHFRKFGSPGNQYSFLQQYRANGGKFFDESTFAHADRGTGGRHDDAADDRPEQGFHPRQQRSRRRCRLGRLAPGQGSDAILLAADGSHDGELFAARQGDQFRAQIGDRGQGRLCPRPGWEWRAATGFRQGDRRGLEQ